MSRLAPSSLLVAVGFLACSLPGCSNGDVDSGAQAPQSYAEALDLFNAESERLDRLDREINRKLADQAEDEASFEATIKQQSGRYAFLEKTLDNERMGYGQNSEPDKEKDAADRLKEMTAQHAKELADMQGALDQLAVGHRAALDALTKKRDEQKTRVDRAQANLDKLDSGR